jgi:hypothetical protein
LNRDAETASTVPAVPLRLPTQVPLPPFKKDGDYTSFFASTSGEDKNRLEYIPSRQKDRELEKSVRKESMTASRLPDRHSSTWQPPNTWQSNSYDDEDEYNCRKQEATARDREEKRDVRRKDSSKPSRPRLGPRRRTS